MSQPDFQKPIVIDNGTSYSKNGFAGEDEPRSTFPTLIGIPRYPTVMKDLDEVREYYAGKEAFSLRGVLKLRHPIKFGQIDNWEALEKLWRFTFFENLRVNPSEHPVLLADPSVKDLRNNRQKMAEVLFETFNVPALYIAKQALLSLYASGRTTGLVIEMGEFFTRVTPISDGFIIQHATFLIAIGGWHITDYLRRLIITRRGYVFGDPLGRRIVQDIKEKLSYVSLDITKDLNSADKGSGREEQYLLPDSESLFVGTERFEAPEAFFDPKRIDSGEPPLHELVCKAINHCCIDLRSDLRSNIILSGGSSMFPNLAERLDREISKIVPESYKIKIHSPRHRYYSVWFGGSILGATKTSSSMWITQQQYKDFGPTIIY